MVNVWRCPNTGESASRTNATVKAVVKGFICNPRRRKLVGVSSRFYSSHAEASRPDSRNRNIPGGQTCALRVMFPFVRQERPLKRNRAVVSHKTMPPHRGGEHFKPRITRLAAIKIIDKPTAACHPLDPADKANNLDVGQMVREQRADHNINRTQIRVEGIRLSSDPFDPALRARKLPRGRGRR